VSLLPLFLAGLLATAPAAVTLRFEGGLFRVEGEGVAEALRTSPPEALLRVLVEATATPVTGEYAVEGSTLVFRPKYPLSPGVSYRAVWREGALTRVVRLPTSTGPPPRVEAVYPSSDVLPENQLKLYLSFSVAMSRGEAYRHVHLLDEAGRTGDLPFLEIAEELWDREGRRLTLLFDPGRIKRGVRPREELGSALVAGRRYTLAVDAAWPDAEGRPLAAGYRKAFSVGPADREPIDPGRWHLVIPAAGARDPLVVDFGEPLESALAVRLIEVKGPGGRRFPGEVRLERAETRWTFTPDGPWRPGRYTLSVDRVLEDLAGNRVGRAFDVDVFERVERPGGRGRMDVPFTVRAPGRAGPE
jgi:hypothetical protein